MLAKGRRFVHFAGLLSSSEIRSALDPII